MAAITILMKQENEWVQRKGRGCKSTLKTLSRCGMVIEGGEMVLDMPNHVTFHTA